MVGEAPKLSSFTCKNCGAAVEVRAGPLTVTAVCPNCGSLSDREEGDFKIVSRALLPAIKPRIPMGTKTKFRGQMVQVIGFMVRADVAEPDYTWEEYLLFNPFTGFTWLVENAGHWNYVKMTKSLPKVDSVGLSLTFLGEKYKVFEKGAARVKFVLGEFYWQVRIKQVVTTLDAIRPPLMVSIESDSHETVYSIAEYVPPDEIRSIFRPDPMPTVYGIGPNQPVPFEGVSEAWRFWVVAFLLLFLSQVLLSGGSSPPLYPPPFAVPIGGIHDFPFAKFATTRTSSSVIVQLSAQQLAQSWVSVTLRAVPDGPGSEGLEMERDLSYYAGHSEDGPWVEDQRSAEFLLNALPRGSYTLLVSAVPKPNESTVIGGKIQIEASVWSNFWLALLVITLPLILVWFIRGRYNRSRWSHSDFNPYQKSSA